MFARVIEVMGPSDRIDAGIAEYRDLVLPAVKTMDGFERVYLLVDRAGGRSLSITVWDSQEAMRASDEAANQLSARLAEFTTGEATTSHYEIAVVEPSE